MRYDFKDVLSTPPPAVARSCQPPACMRVRTPPSCHAIRCPIALRRALRPPPLVMLSTARSPCPCQPLPPLPRVVHPPTLIVLSTAHPRLYLIVVCWISGEGTWLPTQCLALSAPSLSPCYPPPACFTSCSPTIHLPYFLIVLYWLMSLPSRDGHYP